MTGCGPTIVRVVDGRPTEGPFIVPEAYALYAYAAIAEADGDKPTALARFEAAASYDPASPDPPTRIGALRCALGMPDADVAFQVAESKNRSFAPLYRERARCAITRAKAFESAWLAEGKTPPPHDGNARAAPGIAEATYALTMAERAVALDPEDLESSFLRARALARLGRIADAAWILRAVAARRPYLVSPWRELNAIVGETPDTKQGAALRGEASAMLQRIQPDLAPLLRSSTLFAGVDTALAQGDVRSAEHLALAAHVGLGELALRAVALGRAAMARDLASTVLAADPADSAARVGMAAAADLEGDTVGVARAMRAIPAKVVMLSALARVLFAVVLVRRVGADEAKAWATAVSLGDAVAGTKDPLVVAAGRRLEATALP
jgi:tetratricopeptide (TPR) repeat protein